MRLPHVHPSLLGWLLTSSHLFVQARIPSKSRRLQEEGAITAGSPPASPHTQPNRNLQSDPIDENCPGLYPEESKIQLSLTEDFLIQKVNVTKELSTVVSWEHAGKPIDELEDEKRLIYERFDGFTNGCNDQALVAKTQPQDGGICFATFQSTANRLDVGGIPAYIAYARGMCVRAFVL